MRLSEEEAYDIFLKHRWPETDGNPVCPLCGHDRVYHYKVRKDFKCRRKVCGKRFSVTSGTIFHSRKLAFRDCLALIAIFVNTVEGVSALEITRQLGISHKSAWVFMQKMREAITESRSKLRLGGEVEIDGAYVGGYFRPPNTGREGKRPIFKRNKQCVLTLVQRNGPSLSIVVDNENTATVLRAAQRHLLPGTVVYSDEANAYDALTAWFDTRRINHRWAWAVGPVSTNQAESVHARLRRAERVYHHISGRYLILYAFENNFRHDRRRVDNRSLFSELIAMTLAHPESTEFKGRWQSRGAGEQPPISPWRAAA